MLKFDALSNIVFCKNVAGQILEGNGQQCPVACFHVGYWVEIKKNQGKEAKELVQKNEIVKKINFLKIFIME